MILLDHVSELGLPFQPSIFPFIFQSKLSIVINKYNHILCLSSPEMELFTRKILMSVSLDDMYSSPLILVFIHTRLLKDDRQKNYRS